MLDKALRVNFYTVLSLFFLPLFLYGREKKRRGQYTYKIYLYVHWKSEIYTDLTPVFQQHNIHLVFSNCPHKLK